MTHPGCDTRYDACREGRFTQPDTIIPNPTNPQDLNRYTYVRNNPINYNDPTGHEVCYISVDRAGQCYEVADGESWALTRAEESAIVDSPVIAPHIFLMRELGIVDTGKYGDGNFDGNAWKGDFETIASGRNDAASPALRWAAGAALEDGSFELYKTKDRASFFQKLVPDGLCGGASFAAGLGGGGGGCVYWSNGGDWWSPGFSLTGGLAGGAFIGAGAGPTWTSERPSGVNGGFSGCGEGGVGATASACTAFTPVGSPIESSFTFSPFFFGVGAELQLNGVLTVQAD